MTLRRCLASFATTLRVLQTASSLRRVARELCEDLAEDGCVYGEIRYCPSLHLEGGMTYAQAVSAVGAGLRDFHEQQQQQRQQQRQQQPEPERPRRRPAQFRQILTALRDLGASEAKKVANLAAKHKDDGSPSSDLVVGFDLAGNEQAHPPELFVDAFEVARLAGLGLTLHAGEGSDAQSVKNVVAAVETLRVQRIGHCVAAGFSPEALRAVLRHNRSGGGRPITIETCPTSNCHTCPAVASVAESPAVAMHRNGLRCVPCTDNALLSATRTSQEYALLLRHTDLTKEDLEAMARFGVEEAGFARRVAGQ
jgi:adenosine deaminase